MWNRKKKDYSRFNKTYVGFNNKVCSSKTSSQILLEAHQYS